MYDSSELLVLLNESKRAVYHQRTFHPQRTKGGADDEAV